MTKRAKKTMETETWFQLNRHKGSKNLGKTDAGMDHDEYKMECVNCNTNASEHFTWRNTRVENDRKNNDKGLTNDWQSVRRRDKRSHTNVVLTDRAKHLTIQTGELLVAWASFTIETG